MCFCERVCEIVCLECVREGVCVCFFCFCDRERDNVCVCVCVRFSVRERDGVYLGKG